MSYAKNFLKMDKIDRLFDAMEHPEHYTSAEIEAMMSDPEVKEVFDLLDRTKSSLQMISTPDVEKEWDKFKSNHRRYGMLNRRRLTKLISRNAAASIAIGIASFTAVAAIVGVGINHFNHREAPTAEIIAATEPEMFVADRDTIRIIDSDQEEIVEIIVFDNEPLESIMDRIARHYGYEVVFEDNTSKSLRLYFRWNQSLPIEDIAESLNNFEQIHLTLKDNTIKID